MQNKKLRMIVHASIIAAIYASLTYALAPISYGQIQVRVAEALTVLPFLTPAAIPGLFIGCLIANVVGGLGWLDIIFGSLASLIAALATYTLRKTGKMMLAPLPPVIVNALVIGWVVSTVYELPLLITMVFVGAGQLISCYALGYPLLRLCYKNRVLYKLLTGKTEEDAS